MKIAFMIGLLFSISTVKANIVAESFYIKNTDPSYFRLLKSRPELTIDHVEKNGFEIYGPKGLGKFLTTNNIPHFSMKIASLSAVRGYPSPEETATELKSVTDMYPDLAQMVSIGKSVKGRDLWVVKLSKNVKVNDDRPEFKYIANMHGDEIVGRELMMRLIKDLLANYGKDPVITNLLDRAQIYIMPSMNPDGAAAVTRGNAKNVDLNRDFPDYTTSDNKDVTTGRAPETAAVMNWQKGHNFVLSANFHGGAEVANYPWDAIAEKFPNEDYIKELCLEYATLAPYIGASTAFDNGITNGFAWYKVNGGMQDWSIRYRKDLQITIEVSNTKWPDYSKIDYYYAQNKLAMLKFMERAIP
ncbi:MAG: succinylglutamate desuccinylase/aspartoacylase family protein [Rhizobacter sp.]|nr:succinylglutamate desuccinylase/aspartoacylase family protein [Bacteriovorax sp.]